MGNTQYVSAEYLFCYESDTVVYTLFLFQCVLFNIPLFRDWWDISSYLSFYTVSFQFFKKQSN